MTARYRIHVDRKVCLGSGVCASTAARYYELGEDGRAHPPNEVVDADEDVIMAAEWCPTEAITITDADTGEPLVQPVRPVTDETGRPVV